MERSLVIFLSFLTLLSLGDSGPLMSCPSAEDLFPCLCNRLAIGLHVKCLDFNDNALLIRAFKVLRDYDIQTVLLYDLKLTELLPSHVFDGLLINELRVEKSKLKFPEPAFSGLDESLHVLNVAQHSMIKSSENFSIAKLTKLTELIIKKNPLDTVRDKWLNGKIPNVKKIVLDENEIRVIEGRAFADLSSLSYISVAENRIKKVERSMFPRPAEELQTIDLSGNEIPSLPYDFFFEMPKLEKVILSGNDISTLPENTWKTVWEQLNTVLLFENNLICDERLDWLKDLTWPNQVVGNCVAPSKLVGKSLKEVYKT